ncbi:hypothetical protein MUK42_16295 [Musa troglodytarum]|uniref:CLU central domain-containing protein n=1 Tax=Musa troglodytarum TaxID=320322 RepID=A0A9E7HCT3_9LILI|nr:hypothetical protein MUK42_16295 [Musa troglodytarum]
MDGPISKTAPHSPKTPKTEEGLPSSFHSEPPPLPLPLTLLLFFSPTPAPLPKNPYLSPMAGKSKGKHKGRTLNSDSVSSAESQLKPLDSSALSHDGSGAVEASNGDANGVEGASRTPATDGSVGDKAQKGDAPATATKQAEGDLHLYPVPVKALSGEKLELQAEAAERSQSSARTRTQAPEAPCNQDISSGDVTDLLRESEDHDLGPAITHFFNCFIGHVSPVAAKGNSDNMQSKTQKKAQGRHQSQHKFMKGQIRRLHGEFSTNNRLSYMHLTSEGLWSRIQEFANFKYQVGITIAARKYDLGASVPFQTSDILNLQPVVKHSVPTCSEAKDLMESGKARLSEVSGNGFISCGYGNIALFYHGLNQTELGLRHMSRTLLLLSLSSGPDHPDVAATFINVAMMYQDIGNMETALRYLQEALKKNERLLGPEHIQTAHEKKTHDILVKQLGEEDSRTKESESWMETFRLREQQVSAQKQKGQTVDSASALKAIHILKANPELAHAFQTAARLFFVEGVDERAAQAVAEARKKAAARGILVRQNAAPVQPLPPLSQLLNIINSSSTPDAPTSGQAQEEPRDASNGWVSDGSVGATDASGSGHKDQAPVGLGTSLASLDSKKQKLKSKATS